MVDLQVAEKKTEKKPTKKSIGKSSSSAPKPKVVQKLKAAATKHHLIQNQFAMQLLGCTYFLHEVLKDLNLYGTRKLME